MTSSLSRVAKEYTASDALDDARALLAQLSDPEGRAATVDELERSLRATLAHADTIESHRLKLLQQQVALKTVISSVPFFVFWKDRDCVYRGCNDIFASLGGLKSPDEIIGKTDYDMPWTKAQSDLYVEDDLRVIHSGKPKLNIEESNLDADGNEKVILTSKVPLQAEDGTIIGMLGIFADITARKQMEKDLSKSKELAEAANQAKSDFLAAVGHELRTPLALVLGPLDSLLDRLDLPADMSSELERVRRNALRLKALMDDVLDFAKADAGKTTPHDDVVDPEALVRSLVDDVRAAATARGLEIIADTEPVGLVMLDRQMCEKILLNLIGNALKFTPSGGKIFTTLRVVENTVELGVRDTGIGIAERDLGLLFQRFQQIDSSSTRRHEGTGLGLALIKQFAELMGGTVGVDSELGRGSRFFVRLPLKPCPMSEVAVLLGEQRRADLATLNARFLPGSPGPSAADARHAVNLDGPVVVLAEDNVDLRAYLVGLLERDYRVIACPDGAAALAEATRHEPDVIITDIMMPEMDGYELLARVKANPRLSEIPVILLTALASHDAVATSLARGAVDFLNKPFVPAELLARVAVAARLSAARQKLHQRNGELVQAHARLAARNAAMRVMLDNIDQGLFTIDGDGHLSEERSSIVDQWFGPYEGRPLFSAYMAADARFAESFVVGFEALREGFLPREISIRQLPKRLEIGQRKFDCKYLPIGEGAEDSRGVLTIVNDVTLQLQIAAAGAEQGELLAVYTSLMRDRNGFLGFFDEASETIGKLLDRSTDAETCKRLLHTLKGNAGMMRLNLLADLCHRGEDDLDAGKSVGLETLERLKNLWSAIGQTLKAVVGDRNLHSIEVAREDVRGLARQIREGANQAQLLASVDAWHLESAEKPLARLAEYARRLAERLHKGKVTVDVEAHGLRLDPDRWTPLWSNLIHMVRNAVDHGIEGPAAREKAGKPSQAHLRLTASMQGENVVVEVQDDGPGIDWKTISRIALEKGLPSTSDAELLDVILRPDFSTREEVTMTAGRGVGLAAVADSVRKLGGTISVESKVGSGTRWRLSLPRVGEPAKAGEA